MEEGFKECKKCRVSKSLDEFGNDRSRQDGKYSYCKSCRRVKNTFAVQAENLFKNGLKKCSKCKQVLPLRDFHSDSTKPHGKYPRCVLCTRDARREKAASWHRDRDTVSFLLSHGMRKCLNCGCVDDRSLFVKNSMSPGGVAPECLKCYSSRSRVYRLTRLKSNRDYRRIEVFERDRWVCYICGLKIDPEAKFPDPKSATIDHVFPLALGGKDRSNNVRTCCWSCNNSKLHTPLEEFLNKRDKDTNDE